MTRRISTLFGWLFLMVWPALLRAQSPSPSATAAKIGVVNIQFAIANTAEGKKALAELQTKYEPRSQTLARQQQEIQDLQEKLQKQATTLGEDQQIRIRREIDEKTKAFNRASDDFNSDLRTDRQDFISRIGQKMVKIIDEYGQQNGYSLIVDAQVPVQTPEQVLDGQIQIWYARSDVNVTEEVVKRYDVAYPAPSAGTTKPALTNPTAPATRPPSSSAPRPAAPPATKPKP